MTIQGKEPSELSAAEEEVLSDLGRIYDEGAGGLIRLRMLCARTGEFRMQFNGSIGARILGSAEDKLVDRSIQLEVGNGTFDLESWKNDREGLARELLGHGMIPEDLNI